MKKKLYDTSITLLYQIGQESLLPETFRKEIPYSTISSWRKTSLSKYVGSGYRTLFHDSFEVIALKQALNQLKRMVVTTRQIIQKIQPFLVAWYKQVGNDAKFREIFCQCVQLLSKEIGLKSALEELNFSKDRYYLWLNAGKPDCARSQKSLCT